MSYTSLTRFPRMESPSRWDRPAISLGTGWHDEMVALLKTKVIPAKRDRFVGKGDKKTPIPAKGCAVGIAPYLLHAGGRRGEADMRARNEWTHLLLDLDAAPLAIDDLLDVVERAFGHLRHASWTTWSCKDGYASARLLLPLSRTVNEEGVIALFWLARRMVLDAGLPGDSAKPDEPCVDSRCLDGRLFYLPAIPASPVPADKWGGVRPRGFVSPDHLPVLDVDAVLDAARKARASDEGPHLAGWPHVPVPGKRKQTRSRVSGGASGTGTISLEGADAPDAPEVHVVDFGALQMFGTGLSVLAWADANLPTPNTEVGIGGWVFHPEAKWEPGDSALNYDTARLHRDENGRLWAKDWVEGDVYVHVLRRVTIEEVDAAEDAAASPTIEKAASRLLRDGKYGDVIRLVVPAENPSDEALGCVQEALWGLEGEDAERERERKDVEARDALTVYADRLAKKKEKVAEVPEEVREGAEAALKLATGIVRAVMARRAWLGLQTSRPKGEKPCGVPLALHNGYDATVVGARICRDEDCPVHGPTHEARRIAAVVKMPLFRKSEDEGGLPTIGEPMGSRTLHEYRFPSSKLGKFQDACRVREFPGNSALLDDQEGRTRNFRETSPTPSTVHGYVTFSLGNGEIAALATSPLKLGTGKKGGRPSALAGSYVGEVRAEDAEARIVELGLLAIRATDAGEIDGLELEARVVPGTVTSSQTLHLDPEGTARVARAAPWLAVGEVGLSALRDALKAAGVEATLRDEGEPGERVTARSVHPAAVAAAVTAAGGTPYGRPRARKAAPFTVVVDPGITDMIDEITRETA